MVDITKCSGEHCPLKESCYRYFSKANPYWQSYFDIIPYDLHTNECEDYWKMDQFEKSLVKKLDKEIGD